MYDSYVQRFELREGSEDIFNAFRDNVLAKVEPGFKVHEVGTGTGFGLREFKTQLPENDFNSCTFFGSDIDDDLVKFANYWHSEYENIEVKKLSYENAPDIYDLIFLIDVYQYFSPIDRFQHLLKMLKGLSDRGSLVIIDKELFSYFGIKMTIKKEPSPHSINMKICKIFFL